MKANAEFLFVHGGGKGAFEVDRLLAESFQHALGPYYSIRYPQMPEEETARYADWQDRITAELASLQGRITLVSHSVGGSILLKYLAQKQTDRSIAGLFLIAAPFFGVHGWQDDDLALPQDAAERLSGIDPIAFYHKRDDETVPVAHVELYAAAFPRAAIRVSATGGHQFGNDLTTVAEDITKTQHQ